MAALAPNPSAPWASPPAGRVWASPLYRGLVRRYGRIEFVIPRLRGGRLYRIARSPPVASHPASRRRSYIRLQAGVGIPGEDFHLPDRLRLQAHGSGLRGCNPIDRTENGREIWFDNASFWFDCTTMELLYHGRPASRTRSVREISPVFSSPPAVGQLGYILLRRCDRVFGGSIGPPSTNESYEWI